MQVGSVMSSAFEIHLAASLAYTGEGIQIGVVGFAVGTLLGRALAVMSLHLLLRI